MEFLDSLGYLAKPCLRVTKDSRSTQNPGVDSLASGAFFNFLGNMSVLTRQSDEELLEFKCSCVLRKPRCQSSRH